MPIGMPRSRQSLTNPETGGPGKPDPHGCSRLASPFLLEQGAVGGLGGILSTCTRAGAPHVTFSLNLAGLSSSWRRRKDDCSRRRKQTRWGLTRRASSHLKPPALLFVCRGEFRGALGMPVSQEVPSFLAPRGRCDGTAAGSPPPPHTRTSVSFRTRMHSCSG